MWRRSEADGVAKGPRARSASCADCADVFEGAPPCGTCPRQPEARDEEEDGELWAANKPAMDLWSLGNGFARDGMSGMLRLADLHAAAAARGLGVEEVDLALDVERSWIEWNRDLAKGKGNDG